MKTGTVVFSFDFELLWGSYRHALDSSRIAGLEKAREVAERLLDILVRYNISATWATVGHLMLRSDDYFGSARWQEKNTLGDNWYSRDWTQSVPMSGDPNGAAVFAPDIVEQIVECPVYQEIASHSFSHVILGDSSCTNEIATFELEESKRAAQLWGRDMTSLVFPRNHIAHLDVLKKLGFNCYRAANSEWYWFGTACQPIRNPSVAKALRTITRLLRWCDEKLRITPPVSSARKVHGLWEIPHSMFFPGLQGVSRFITMRDRVVRAERGLQAAASQGRIFSLYTHPHNFFPRGTAKLLDAYEQICCQAARLRDTGTLKILTMGQIAQQLNHEETISRAA